MTERTSERQAPTLKWDESGMRSTYANVVHATGTREEISVIFGLHQAWRPDVKEVNIQVLDRIVLSPFAAKRLHALLGHVLREYEARYGALNVDVGAGGVAAPESLTNR
jgi:hypothetical protein